MISVLCVDDEPVLLDIEKAFLEQKKEFHVETATSGAEALRRLKSNSIDAVVADYQMPEMDGIELLKNIRSHDGLPFILFTGRGREEVAIEAINNGVDFYIQKGGDPVAQFAELAHKIRQAVKRWKAERLLVESEQKFHTFAEFTHDWEYWQAPDNSFVYTTPACERTTGYTQEEFQGNADLINTIVHPDDRALWYNHRHTTTAAASVKSVEFRIIRKDGEIRWISHRCQPVQDPHHTILGIRAGNTDITERKLMEVALRESEEKYRTVVETANEGIWILDSEYNTTFVNPRLAEILGYPAREMLGRPMVDFLCKDSLPEFNNQASARKAGRSSVYEQRFRHKNGSVVWCRVSATPIKELTGVFSGSFAMLTDVTKRKQAEQMLAENMRMLDTLMNNLPGMVYRCKNDPPEWTTEFASRGSLDLTGYEPGELINNRIITYGSLIHPEDLDTVLSRVSHAVATTTPFHLEYRIINKDGKIRWVEEQGRGIFDENNEPVFLEGYISDITERKMAESALSKSEEKFRTLFESMLEGFAYCKMICDVAGKPSDIIIVDVNPAYYRITGTENIAGKRFSEIFPGIWETVPGLLECLGRVAATGKSESMELNFSPINKWLFLSVTSPLAEHVILEFEDITERRHAEDRVRENEERFRSLIEKAPIAINVVRNGLHIYANPKFLSMFGYLHSEDLYNKPILVVLAPRVRAEIKERMQRRALGLPEPTEYETVGLRADGSEFSLQVVTTIIPLAEGDASIGFFTDITERRLAEDALRSSEERFRTIFEKGPIGMALVDTAHRFVRVNSAFCAMLGYTEDQMKTKTFESVTYPENIMADVENVKKLTNGEISYYKTEKRYIGKDGRIIWGDIAVVVLRDKAGQVQNYLAMIADISKRKQIEDALRESEAKYRELVDNANTIILRIDADAKLTYFNEFAQEFFGYSEQEIIGRSLMGTIIPVTESVTGRDMNYIIRDLVDRPDRYAVHESECVKKNGDRVWIAWQNKPILDEKGALTGMSSIGTDITDRRNAEEALVQANKKLNLLNSITRHDLLNQLTPLAGYLDLVRERVGDAEAREYLDREKKALDNLYHIVRFTKDYQDIGLYRPLWQKPGSLVDQIATSVDLRDVAVHNDLGSLEIFADPLLEKVIYNLLDNAVRHGGILTAIRFSYYLTDTWCVLVCEDDGAGILENEKERIFERGYGKHTGFGLFLAREILGITGFTLQETGIPGKGARFEITIPKGSYRIP